MYTLRERLGIDEKTGRILGTNLGNIINGVERIFAGKVVETLTPIEATIDNYLASFKATNKRVEVR